MQKSSSLVAAPGRGIARDGISAARIVGLLIAVMFMGSTLLTPLYPLYRREFGFSEVVLTLVYATYVVGNLVALFFLGRVSDQIGRRRTGLPALALAGATALIFLCASGTPWLFVGRALSGLAIGAAVATATAWAVELLHDEARASALATTANMLGVAIGPLLAGMLAQFAPAPLRTSHVVYLLLIGLVARTALRAGVLLLLPAAALLLLTQMTASIAALLGATLFGGAALALGYRGTLQVVNAIAPAERRAEVVASFMIACFLGNSLPVIGIAVLSQLAGATAANVVFACMIAALGALAFAVVGRAQPSASC